MYYCWEQENQSHKQWQKKLCKWCNFPILRFSLFTLFEISCDHKALNIRSLLDCSNPIRDDPCYQIGWSFRYCLHRCACLDFRYVTYMLKAFTYMPNSKVIYIFLCNNSCSFSPLFFLGIPKLFFYRECLLKILKER